MVGFLYDPKDAQHLPDTQWWSDNLVLTHELDSYWLPDFVAAEFVDTHRRTKVSVGDLTTETPFV